jgi:hypothetical protein
MSTLDRLKELEAKATPGPWPKIEYSLLDPLTSADREFIYAMRNALPKLLAVVEAAKNARKSQVLRRSGYYDVSQFDEVFAEFDRLSAEL